MVAWRVTGWLRSARFDDGLLIRGRPRYRRAADLWLGPAHVEVRRRGRVVTFEWDSYGETSVHLASDAWWIGGSTPKSQPGGVGVGVWGGTTTLYALQPLWESTHPVQRRVSGRQPRAPVPLRPVLYITPRVDAERSVVRALCAVPGDRPELRPGLASPERVTRLAVDLRSGARWEVRWMLRFRRRPTEVVLSLRRLGYTHRYLGRPLPGDPVASVDAVTDAVVRDLAANHYTRQMRIERAQVRQLVARFYCDVRPWPFGALVDR